MKEFTLKLTEKDVEVIGIALGEVLFKFAFPVIQKLQTQINEQVNEKKE